MRKFLMLAGAMLIGLVPVLAWHLVMAA